jgi:hypothetical protein
VNLPHSIIFPESLEVQTPFGQGYVLYCTVYGPHQNDVWCVADKSTGELRHYQTTQLKMTSNGMLGILPQTPKGKPHATRRPE